MPCGMLEHATYSSNGGIESGVQHVAIYALGVAISPIPIGATLIILTSRVAVANAVSFAAGWIVGLSISAVTFTVIVTGLNVTNSGPAWISLAELVMGLGFFAVAGRLWLRSRPDRLQPYLLDQVDRFTYRRSATLGTLLSCANPKVMALSLGAALSIAGVRANALVTLSEVALFVVIGAAGVLAPIAAYLALPRRGAATLAALRGWLARHERTVFTVFALAIGAFFIRNGIDSLPS
jgi:hypothetical protein